MSRITFLKKYDFQASWRYRAPRETTQGRRRSQYAVDLGLSRDILRGNGTVTLSVRDVFNTNKFRDIVDDEGFYSESEFQWRPRSVMLTFNYRLNRKKDSERNRQQQDGDGPVQDGGFDQQGQGGGDF